MKKIPISIGDDGGMFLDVYRINRPEQGGFVGDEAGCIVFPDDEPTVLGVLGDSAFNQSQSGIFGAPNDVIEDFAEEADVTPSRSQDAAILGSFLAEIAVRAMDTDESNIGPMVAPKILATEADDLVTVAMGRKLAQLLIIAFKKHRLGEAILMQCTPVADDDLNEVLGDQDDDDPVV